MADALDEADAARPADAAADTAADARALEDPPPCVPDTCRTHKFECGTFVDRCGHIQDCGACKGALFCGALSPNECGFDLPSGG